MHRYTYRDPRLAACLAVQFVTQYGVLSGWTRDLSEKGLQVDLNEPVLLGTMGKVRLHVGHCSLELEAKVAHTEGFTVGLVFAFLSEQESSFMSAILQVLRKSPQVAG